MKRFSQNILVAISCLAFGAIMALICANKADWTLMESIIQGLVETTCMLIVFWGLPFKHGFSLKFPDREYRIQFLLIVVLILVQSTVLNSRQDVTRILCNVVLIVVSTFYRRSLKRIEDYFRKQE